MKLKVIFHDGTTLEAEGPDGDVAFVESWLEQARDEWAGMKARAMEAVPRRRDTTIAQYPKDIVARLGRELHVGPPPPSTIKK